MGPAITSTKSGCEPLDYEIVSLSSVVIDGVLTILPSTLRCTWIAVANKEGILCAKRNERIGRAFEY